MKPVLSATNISLRYGTRWAVRNLTFEVLPGEIVGFLGPNGAGKTSAIRVLTTILAPSSGSFTVGGLPGTEAKGIRSVIGVLPESHGTPPYITAREYLTGYGRLFGLSKKEASGRAAKLLEEVGLGGRMDSLVKSFSRGMRQRLGIARALVNEPKLVFLDEPTLGLDPQAELSELIRWVAKSKGAGVVLCSHLLDEVEEICDSVVILPEGVVAKGPVATVPQASDVLRVRVDELQPALEALGVWGVHARQGVDGWIKVWLGKEDTNAILSVLTRAKVPIRAVGSQFVSATHVSPAIHLVVQEKPQYNPGGILPFTIGTPLVVGGAWLGLKTYRRRTVA